MRSFRIIYAPVENAKELPLENWSRINSDLFPDAEVAKERCRVLTDSHSHDQWDPDKRIYVRIPQYVFKIQLVPENEDYPNRETKRIEAGEYVLLPQVWQPYHTSYAFYNEKTKMISFFDGESEALRDRRTEMKPTRYWGRFIGDDGMFDALLEAGIMSGDFTLAFATTREDIRRVYENGPQSCMSGEAGQYYSSDIHPVEAYASPDLALAYLTVADEIISRALCNVNTKEYVRIYGDIGRMTTFLNNEGFKENQYCMGGVRILKIFAKRGDNERTDIVMAPYIDGPNVEMTLASPDDEYMTIISRPIVISGSTSGYYNFR